MGDLKIDYSGLGAALERSVAEGARKGRESTRRGSVKHGLARLALLVAFAVLPFVLLIRGGVFAYQAWGIGTWPSLLFAVLVTALLLVGYVGAAARVMGVGQGVRRILARGVAGLAVVYVVFAMAYVAGANVKSDVVRAEYRSLHPLLRVAASTLILADPASVITDASRTLEDYRLMGLTPYEASLHFEQGDGYVHALDLRTQGRSELRNRLVELGFWALGFHSLRHVGTADHLHVSLRLPG